MEYAEVSSSCWRKRNLDVKKWLVWKDWNEDVLRLVDETILEFMCGGDMHNFPDADLFDNQKAKNILDSTMERVGHLIFLRLRQTGAACFNCTDTELDEAVQSIGFALVLQERRRREHFRHLKIPLGPRDMTKAFQDELSARRTSTFHQASQTGGLSSSAIAPYQPLARGYRTTESSLGPSPTLHDLMRALQGTYDLPTAFQGTESDIFGSSDDTGEGWPDGR